jgi:hypothetical protein
LLHQRLFPEKAGVNPLRNTLCAKGPPYWVCLKAFTKTSLSQAWACYAIAVDYCEEHETLKANAVRALQEIIEFSNKLLNAIKADELDPHALDKDLENAVGSKERAFGALSQHRKEHGC